MATEFLWVPKHVS